MTLALSISEARLRGHSEGAVRRSQASRQPDDVDFSTGRPTAPANLSKEERKVWHSTIRLLAARGTLTAGDGLAVALFAQTSVEHRAERELLESEGRITRLEKLDSHNNRVVVHAVNPRVRIVRDLEKQLALLLRELGLTPLRRHQVRKVKQPLTLDELVRLP